MLKSLYISMSCCLCPIIALNLSLVTVKWHTFKKKTNWARNPIFLSGLHQWFLLHLHEIVKGSCFHCSLSVCVWVCLSRNKIPAEWTHQFWQGFAKWLFTALAQTLLLLVTLGQRSRSQWRYVHFLHDSLLIFLLWIPSLCMLLCPW